MKLRDRDDGCFNTRKPCYETKQRIDEVILPDGMYSGMTKRVAISDGTHTPGLNEPGGKRRSRKD